MNALYHTLSYKIDTEHHEHLFADIGAAVKRAVEADNEGAHDIKLDALLYHAGKWYDMNGQIQIM